MGARASFIACLGITVLAGCGGGAGSKSGPAVPVDADSHPELAFFNDLSAKLEIELSAPTQPIGDTANQRATPGATIRGLKLGAEVLNEDAEGRALTTAELQSLAFAGAEIRLRGDAEIIVRHAAPNGKFFSVQDLLNAVEETERQTRERTEWFGGIDVHHVYFEGIHPSSDGVWDIMWGS